ncbi:hypothetical protein DA2_1465 [Desulfovibrio sp. A2]|nr:hypothetical protein DA2_1465 [Desulfovibrio sp. A2]
MAFFDRSFRWLNAVRQKNTKLRKENFEDWPRIKKIAEEYFEEAKEASTIANGEGLYIYSSDVDRENFEKFKGTPFEIENVEYGRDYIAIRFGKIPLPVKKLEIKDGKKHSSYVVEHGTVGYIMQTTMGHVVFYIEPCKSEVHEQKDKGFVWRLFKMASDVEHRHIISFVKCIIKTQANTTALSNANFKNLKNAFDAYYQKNKDIIKAHACGFAYGVIASLVASLLFEKMKLLFN